VVIREIEPMRMLRMRHEARLSDVHPERLEPVLLPRMSASRRTSRRSWPPPAWAQRVCARSPSSPS
jgi:hypothetical protein